MATVWLEHSVSATSDDAGGPTVCSGGGTSSQTSRRAVVTLWAHTLGVNVFDPKHIAESVRCTQMETLTSETSDVRVVIIPFMQEI